MAEEPLPRLARHLKGTNQELSKDLIDTRDKIFAAVLSAGGAIALSGVKRRKLFLAIDAQYRALSGGIDASLKAGAAEVIEDFKDVAAEHVAAKGATGSATTFSDKYVAEVFARVHPSSGPNIAAVRTANMAAGDKRAIQRAITETARRASLEGWTLRQQQQELTIALAELVDGGLDSWQFIDKSGRKWKNSNYFNMLTRTVNAEVARGSYHDGLVEQGYDLAATVTGGMPCPICTNWAGVIYSITGKTKGFPTEADLRAAGVYHISCVCIPAYVDDITDADDIEKQKNEPNPEEPSRDEWNDYSRRITANASPKISITSKTDALMKGDTPAKQLREGTERVEDGGESA